MINKPSMIYTGIINEYKDKERFHSIISNYFTLSNTRDEFGPLVWSIELPIIPVGLDGTLMFDSSMYLSFYLNLIGNDLTVIVNESVEKEYKKYIYEYIIYKSLRCLLIAEMMINES